MKNLVEQASNWLQSEACRSGNIVERTNTVVSAFRSYILEEKKEVCENTGLSLSSITDKIDATQFCLRFYSSHLLNGDADYYNKDFANHDFLARYVNYVFPAASSKSEGYSDDLRKVFNQTETVSLLHETILNPERLMNSGSSDIYLSSQFGLMDAILDEKLGFTPKRDEGELLLVRKG